MNNYIKSCLGIALLFFSACGKKLDVIPPNSIQDAQIKELLASGDTTKIKLIIGSMANSMPLMFNYSGIQLTGTANISYYTNQSLGAVRCLEGNDMILGDQQGLGSLAGEIEYDLGDFQASLLNRPFWFYAWTIITQANQMLDYLTDDIVTGNKFLQDAKARGLIVRAYGYNFLMENYQDAYMQGGKSKLGMPLYTTFNPNQEYKARSSSDETYSLIKNDINTAISLFQLAGIGYTANQSDIDLGVAKFLLARVSVVTGDWPTAIQACDDILGNYPKLLNEANYGGKNTGTVANPIYDPNNNGFLNNAVNPEVILGFPAGVALTYFNNMMNPFGPGYGGKNKAFKRIDNRLYDKIDPKDYRENAFQGYSTFGNYTYPSDNTVNTLPSFINFKFAATIGLDGSNLHSNETTFSFMRSSEVLLMKAEAQAQQGGNETLAKSTLNILLKARTRSGEAPLTCDTYSTMTGLNVLEMVQLQTRIEMWGETGLEFYNNKRWNIPVNRGNSTSHVNKSSLSVKKMTIQIPADEMDNNPKMVQNN